MAFLKILLTLMLLSYLNKLIIIKLIDKLKYFSVNFFLRVFSPKGTT